MADFPTLSVGPVFPLEEGFVDEVIRTPTEAGYRQQRARFTYRRRWFAPQYRGLTNSDKGSLQTFEGTTLGGGAISFNWTHPQSSTVYGVVLDGPINYHYIDEENWEASFRITQQ
jgi:hypothetical protein